ncbi:MAG: DUF4209 domain-containing protein [Bacteroidetes bacterium]|nr:DUF4209 domain-containing protein [Bacteroidota bacterium]
MNVPERYKELFESFDNNISLALSEQKIGHKILELTPEPSHASEFEKAELFAFQFVEIYKGTESPEIFYKPHRSRPLPDGSEQVYPDIAEVTPTMMEYWMWRAQSSKHPVMRARYAGLAYEFQKQVSDTYPNYAIGQIFSQSLIETVNRNLISEIAYKAGKLEKALTVSLKLKDSTGTANAKNELLALDKSVSLTETKNFWTYGFDILLLKQKGVATEEEEGYLIESLEQRFKEFVSLDENAAWEAAKRLSDYYKKKNDKNNTLRILTAIEAAVTSFTEENPSFQKIYWLEKLYKLFEQRGFKANGGKLLIQIREISKLAIEEMKAVQGSTTINQSQIDDLVNELLKINGDNLFITLALRYSLDRESIEREVQGFATQNSIYSLFKKEVHDAKGRKIGLLPPVSHNTEPYIVQKAAFQIQFNSLFFRFIVDEGMKREILDATEVLNYIKLSPIFENANLSIIRKATEYYFVKDYVGFIHTIIPQIEEAIRNLIEKNGGNVLVEKDGFYMLRTLDHLLNDAIAMDTLGSSLCLHLRALLTDKVGMNLRNNVMHGIINPDKFNQMNADSILIALLVLVLKSIPE